MVAGLFAGLALDSKYTAAFLPLGLGLYALLAAPRSLRRFEPWIGAAIAGLSFLPVVLWNAQNGWIGFSRQAGRVGDWRPERAVGFVVELVGSQIGLVTPGVFVLFVMGIVMAVRVSARSRDPAWTLLAALSVPPALVFLQHALGDRVQGNWPIILYPAAAIAASGLTAPIWHRSVWPSALLGFAVTAIVYVHVITAWPAIGGDPTARQLFGWHSLAEQAETVRKAETATFIAAEPYGLAAELAWNAAENVDVIGVGDHWSPTGLPRAGTGGRAGILIRPERYPRDAVAEAWRDVTYVKTIVRQNGGGEIEGYAVFQIHTDDRSPSRMLPTPMIRD